MYAWKILKHVGLMDRDRVLASRESERINDFLEKMVSQKRISEFERQIILQEGMEVRRHAGHFDSKGRAYPGGDEELAVTRQTNHCEREKVKELHPELAEELARFIEHRPHHPLPPVTPRMSGRGTALKQYESLVDFIAEKRETGEIEHGEAHAMYEPAIRVFEDSGVFLGDLSESTDKAVLIQAHHLMKQKLLEICPSLGPELKSIEMPGRTR